MSGTNTTEHDLTEGMKKALKQIGFGVTARVGGGRPGWFDADNERLDLRSASPLLRRKLIYWFTSGGAPNVTKLRLTDEGDKIFEELLESERKTRWHY